MIFNSAKQIRLTLRRAKHFSAHAKSFLANKAGNIGMTFAISVVPLVTLVGGGLDYSSAIMLRQRLGHAIDSAALAVGKTANMTDAEATAVAQRVFEANLTSFDSVTLGTLNVTVTPASVTVSANASMQTNFLGLVGINEVQIRVENEVVRANRKIELVMALDNTGSMGSSGKMTAMKSAANELIEILFMGNETSEKVKIGLVPFSQTVNVGSQNQNASWMDVNGLSSVNGENFSPKTHHFEMLSRTSNGQWRGCVEARPAPYDTTDAAASTGSPDTLFVPYFAPDEPDSYYYKNKYRSDQVSGSYDYRQSHTAKYQNASVNNSGSSYGPNYLCTTPPVTALSNVKSTLISSVNSFTPQGWTHIPMGLSWGWRLISPGAPFTEGVSYDDEETVKAMILLTDGENTIAPRNNHNKSYYTAYGYLNKQRLGTSSQYTAVTKLNGKTSTLCENIKAAGIRLYTITFDLSNNTTVQNLMRNCASSPGMYFNSPSNEELRSAFQTIAGDLSKLRLSR